MHNFWLALAHLDPIAIITAGGYAGIALIVFAESGLLIGMFLPGDSLLFAAGLLAGTGLLAYLPLAAVVVLGATIGDSFGYWFGRKVGEAAFARPNSRIFKPEYLERTRAFYAKYGPRAVVLARFVPIVRTITPVLAGTAGMPYARFLSYNVFGGVLWGFGMVSLGYFLGQTIPGLAHYILPISLGIIVVSILPIFVNILKGRAT